MDPSAVPIELPMIAIPESFSLKSHVPVVILALPTFQPEHSNTA